MIEKEYRQLPNDTFIPYIVSQMEKGHTVTLPLRGNSMRPFLEDRRDKGLMRLATHPRVGDPVLALLDRGDYVLHRIVAIRGDEVTLRGDGNLQTETCRLANVKGEVIGFYRKGRTTLDRTDGRKWRIYSWLWCHLLPARRVLLGLYRRVWIPLLGPM